MLGGLTVSLENTKINNEKKIIAVSGTHGTSKSTIAYSLASFLKKQGKNVIVLNELARECPLPINQEAGDWTQVWVICSQITKEIEMVNNYEYIITDRSVLDAYCYGKVLGSSTLGWTCDYLLPFLVAHIKNHYKKLYLLDPPSFNFNIEDGVRDTNDKFRLDVHNELTNVLDTTGLVYTLVRNDVDIFSDFTN